MSQAKRLRWSWKGTLIFDRKGVGAWSKKFKGYAKKLKAPKAKRGIDLFESVAKDRK